MSVGTIDRFDIRDISIKDLVLDDLSGYFDMLNDIDENMLDRQASIVLYEVYRDTPPLEADIPLVVRRWIAAHSVLRLIPALRTYIAKNEKRGDILERSSTVYYDQLDNLDDIQLAVEQRIHELRNQVQNVLTDEYSVGPPMYDRPGVTSKEAPFVTLDPWRIGPKMFENT
jgi:hypothetical protein